VGSRNRLTFLAAQEKEGKLDEAERKEMAEIPARNLVALRRLPLSPHYIDDPEGAALLDAHRSGGDFSKVASRPAPALRDEYVGNDVCKDCHEKQYQQWQGTHHAKALDGVLAGGAGRRAECLVCHVTGYGVAFVDPAEAKRFAGVGCEACHGTRPDHLKDPAVNKFKTIAESTCLPCHNEDVVPANFSFGSALLKVRCHGDGK
jgi:hypothetical protein